jgi:hypothetical protein
LKTEAIELLISAGISADASAVSMPDNPATLLVPLVESSVGGRKGDEENPAGCR